jgi:hypothetical protein
MTKAGFICGVSLCLCAFVEPAPAQNAATRIKSAQYALGMIRGPQRIDAINTMEFWGTRRDGVTYHVSLSYLTPAMRVDIDVLFPSHLVHKQGGIPAVDLTITKADANNPYVVFPVPENVEKGQHE